MTVAGMKKTNQLRILMEQVRMVIGVWIHFWIILFSGNLWVTILLNRLGGIYISVTMNLCNNQLIDFLKFKSY
jgi:hypothetical protein